MQVRHVYQVLLRYRLPILAATLVLPIVLSLFIQRELDDSIRIWFLDGDPAVQIYDRFLQHFGSDEFIAIAIRDEDVFTPEFLDDIGRLTAMLEGYGPGYSVTSLTNAEISDLIEEVWDGDLVQTIEVRQVSELIADSRGELNEVRQRVHQDRLASQLVSPDDRATLILFHYPHFEGSREKHDLVRELRVRCAELLPGRTIHFAGIAVTDEAFQSLTLQDLRKFIPLTILVIILATTVLFKSFWASLVPMLVVLFSVVSTVGLAGLMGVQLNFVTIIIIPLTMAVSVAVCVHLLAGVRERMQDGQPRHLALESSWTQLLLPCFLSSLTTAAGLLSLLFATLRPLRQFGWMGAAAVLFSFVFSMVLIPIAFTYLHPPKVDPRLNRRLLSRVLRGMTQVAYRRCRFVVGGTVLLCVAAAFGLPRLGISSDMLGYFGEKTVHRVDSRFIDEHLGGSLMINLMVEAPNVLEPEVLRGFEQMEAYLSEQPEVRFVNSPSSTVKLLHERYFGDPQRYRIPDTLAAVTQLVEQISGTALFKSHVNPSATVGHLTARFDGRRLENVIENNPRLESRLAAAFAGTAQGYVTGYGKLVIRMHHYIPTSQVRSFFIAFVVIGLMITVLFRSLRIGIWAIFPNVVPIVVMLGGMGFTGFDLDVATVMIASILLGLIVDDTVHFLARFRIEEQRALAQGSSDAMREALYQTGTGTGRALLTTTVILSCAFWTLILANFVPIRHFGLVSGVGAAIALLCDLVLLPATMRWFPLRKLARRMVVESRAHSLVESERKWNWSQVSTDTAANSDHSGASRP